MNSPNQNTRPIVIALGGNALLQRGQPPEAEIQKANIHIAALAIAKIARHYPVVVTHGNGPQVGLLALQGECEKSCKPYPLDVLGAETEGMIGYLLEQELRNQLPGRDVVTLLTQIVVDRQDPAFLQPTKPIGPVYTLEQAQQLAQERGWAIAADGQGYRRVVASPEPKRIIELPTIQLLVKSGALVVCAGGGGIPVVVNEAGGLQGVEAVIDKDLAAALLAQNLQAQGLLLLTDVDGVYENWSTNYAHCFEQTTPKNLRRYRFAAGSMGPKVEAACRFVETTGQWCGIGKLDQALDIIDGKAGTVVMP
ncbi:carbamate kinase [Synechocystis sp. PCC 6803]|uniref:Carbamate kinase n=1 Tax=Synechocystis sp. (strain ATCC 27184 / PCC 6803 / Kazusa) TaxID=1111708 RepID=ARCC_SYNY3|nr:MULTISPECIES: carbamate kinase [unclassified Synechocystis]P74733.1 RecName: Full=Carbamate kinase [Synechocystis sp. PCC 6803 substr. Kazusa]BAM53271.1 carbamate kinase [Synechocystis sp. PCC 6803] [Bacillus subtilis BEST7613]AGF53402.1 carbamate kinase [Synechocystis sp. PCC 6803]ALJ69269.1 carbamate kinase [Synechocystis sp. PCC 6803]AVP91133.1 carbamate kinase [Synechocystis sp. IPPAS B-1465]MBD2619425.1 carbamate kinase [Synechocystis sp. FACHB-898]